MFSNPLKRLRKKSWLSALPDSIEVPPLGDRAGETKAIDAATVDDISFAIQALNQKSSALYREIEALRHLHDLARKVGAVGSDGAVEAAARHEEVA